MGRYEGREAIREFFRGISGHFVFAQCALVDTCGSGICEQSQIVSIWMLPLNL